MSLGGTYSTGTLTIANGATSFSGSGTLWSVEAEEGDWIFVPSVHLVIGIIDSVTDDTHGALLDAWTGGDLTGVQYRIIKMSWLRYEPALTQQKVRQFIALLDNPTLIYQVSGDAPDPGLGEDGSLAAKLDSGAWKFWIKVSGVWVLQGNPVGVSWKGPWDSVTDFVIGDIVSRNGSAYVATQPSTNQDPISAPAYWDIFTVGGSVYDVTIWDSGRPAASELLARFDMPRTVSFGTNFNGSVASAGTAATASSAYTIEKNGASVGAITFGAGATTGAFSGAAVTFNAGDVLTLIAPSSRDATLANVAITFSGTR